MNVLEYGKAFYKIKRYDILHSFKKKPLHFDTQVEAVAKTLRETGYVLLEGYFSEEQCEMTRQEIDKILIDKKDFVQTDKHDSDHRLFGANNASKFLDDLFWSDDFLVSVRNCFYEHDNIVGSTMAARMDARIENLGSGGGWHRDMVFGRQVKSIAYFSDVTPENGPFQFLDNSHKDSSILETISRCDIAAFQNRFTAAEIDKIIQLGGYDLLTFAGKAGTLMLVDTTSIHRGMPIQHGSRYALTNYWFEEKVPKHIDKLTYK
jgi:hypothetical protein